MLEQPPRQSVHRSRPRRALRRRLGVGALTALLGVGGLAAATAGPAAAAPAVNAPGTSYSTVGQWAAVAGVSLNDFASPSVRVDVTVTPSGRGLVRYAGTHAGVTQVAGFDNNSGDGREHIAFTGAPADVNAALAALELRGSSLGSATITVDAADQPALFNADNGHYYQVVSSETAVTATTAATQAAASSIVVGGTTHTGYLATIATDAENEFLAERAVTYGWIGATDAETEGIWKWFTGPEAGTTFCLGNDPCNSQGGRYVNWASDEPNDSGNNEDYAVINWGVPGSGTWNDLPGNSLEVFQYIVEYGDGALAAPTVATATINAAIVSVPDAPTDVAANPGHGNATVSWVAPASDGGAPITSYVVTAAPGGATCTVNAPATSCTINGLDEGTEYTFTVRAVNGAGPSAPSAATAPVTPLVPFGYEPLPQTRLTDTREGSAPAKPAAGDVVQVPLTGAALPANTTAVLVNLTGVNATGAGFVTLYPCGTERPWASSLNITPGQIVGNLAMVRVPAGTTSLCAYTSTGVDIVVDLVGSFSGDLPTGIDQPGGGLSLARAPFLPATQDRLLDTRDGGTPVQGGNHIELDVTGLDGVPNDANAIVVTVTTDDAEGPGFVTAYSCAAGRPNTSTLNLDPITAIANLAVLPITDGRVCIYTQTTTDIIVDLVGAFAPSHDSVLTATDHHRALDTREGLGGSTTLKAHEAIRLDLTGIVSPDAVAVALNVTATDSAERGWVRVWACGTPMPPTSNLNPVPGRAVPNVVFTSLGTGDDAGTVCIMSHAATDLVVDVQGWFTRLLPPS